MNQNSASAAAWKKFDAQLNALRGEASQPIGTIPTIDWAQYEKKIKSPGTPSLLFVGFIVLV